jgi:hypothetical protein
MLVSRPKNPNLPCRLINASRRCNKDGFDAQKRKQDCQISKFTQIIPSACRENNKHQRQSQRLCLQAPCNAKIAQTASTSTRLHRHTSCQTTQQPGTIPNEMTGKCNPPSPPKRHTTNKLKFAALHLGILPLSRAGIRRQ